MELLFTKVESQGVRDGKGILASQPKSKLTYLPPRAKDAGRMGVKALATTAVDNNASSVLVNLIFK
jgi:hypothetical protein